MNIKFGNSTLGIKPIDTNSLMSAIIICFSLINGAIGIDGISYVTICLAILLFIYGLVGKKCYLHFREIFIVFFVFIEFLFSFLTVGDITYTSFYFFYFIGFCVVSLFAGIQEYDIWKTIKYCEIIGFICCIVFYVRGFSNYNASLQMGISYSLLPVFLFSVVSIFVKSQRTVFTFAVLIMSILFYVTIAPRGVWLTIFVFFVLAFYHRMSTTKEGKANVIKQFITITILLVGLYLIYHNIVVIINVLQSVYSNLTGKNVYALDKLAFLMAQGNIGNGREDLSTFAIDLIKESPIVGHGIGYYETFQDGLYVHELWLQSLCEFGLVSFIPLAVYFAYCLKLVFKNHIESDLQVYYFYILLVNGLVILFYSSVYWKLLLFWFLLGHVIKISKKKTHLFKGGGRD